MAAGGKPVTPLWKKLGLAAGLVAALLALGLAVYSLIGPTRMDPASTMNVAVTEVGMLDAQGEIQAFRRRRAHQRLDCGCAGGRQ